MAAFPFNHVGRASTLTHVVAPPPTPNGDLHIGHLSGPYLGADIYCRCLRQAGMHAGYVISTDDHQSYVDTTAQRLRTKSTQLIARSRNEICGTLDAYSIELVHFGSIGPAYVDFVSDFFCTLLAYDKIAVRQMPVLFDRQRAQYAVEAFITGICAHCLAPCAGGICEACGQPNACLDLLDIDRARYEVRHESRLVLELERYRPKIEARLQQMATHRPWLARLIAQLLEHELQPFVLSYKVERGIAADFAGLAEQKLNVWGEMFPGHMYFLQESAGNLSRTDRYVQFLGFDNSYFYAVVHVALSIAAEEAGYQWPTPIAFVTNQFYNLDDAKFSTSRGHLVWARELANEFNTDLIRLFLALHGPEYQEANFSSAAFSAGASRLVDDINCVVRGYNEALPADAVQAAEVAAAPSDAGALLAAQLAGAAKPQLDLKYYSSSDAARRAINCIRLIGRHLAAGESALVPYVPDLLALCLAPFCPRYAESISKRAGSAVDWAALQPARQMLPIALIELRSHVSR